MTETHTVDLLGPISAEDYLKIADLVEEMTPHQCQKHFGEEREHFALQLRQAATNPDDPRNSMLIAALSFVTSRRYLVI